MAETQNIDKISEEVTTKIIGSRKALSFGLGKLVITYEIPSACVGNIIGKGGRNIEDVKKETKTKIFIWPNPKCRGFHFCKIEGRGCNVKKAEVEIIKIIICKTRSDSQSEDQVDSDGELGFVENNHQQGEKVSEEPEPEIEEKAAAINGIQPTGKDLREKLMKVGKKKVNSKKK